ncbi:thioesterase family protein [Agrobacterium sp. MCAB5]|uniref:thioesterase family protein n=1 Tax=Agrobacterium sp. MCAB5 TaxID=3233042 RepID=UPI003F9163BE
MNEEVGGPLRLWRGQVLADWLDYNGHMTEHRYLQVFGESSDALYGELGVDFGNATNGAYFTLETHIRHRAEAKLHTPLWSETEILGYDEKRLHLLHRLFDEGNNLLATGEHLSIHVKNAAVTAAPDLMQKRIAMIFDEHRQLSKPEGVGSVLKKPLAYSR